MFIASATQDHFSDLLHCLKLKPNSIFVEKGFSNREERDRAKSIAGNIPVYILSQYRYSKIFDALVHPNEKIRRCTYKWLVDGSEISEWVHHIISIDNYIKQTNNQFYISKEGEYTIDTQSNFSIRRSKERILKMEVITDQQILRIDLGKVNRLQTKDAVLEFENEDCLERQLKDVIMNNKNTRLERL